MSKTDSRSPHTDALDTLGTIHTHIEKRDAIHLGVEPVVAGECLDPGDRIGIIDGKAYDAGTTRKGKIVPYMGIVDPFLDRGLDRGDRFWLVVPPRKITSLRHVWEHPDFPDSISLEMSQQKNSNNSSGEPTEEQLQETLILMGDPVAIAKKKIADIADSLEVTVEWLMDNADMVQDGNDEYVYHPDGSEVGEGMGIPDEFWPAYATVKEKKPEEVSTGLYFTCSC